MKEIKVLIVDDAYFFRNLVKKAIKEKPEGEITFTVLDEAKNGTEGITKYFELKPDLVTLDITMPDIDGIEVAKQILSKDPNAKILAISGNTNDDVRQAILDAGALDYLQKPFQPAFLWNKLDGLFEEKEEEIQEEEIIIEPSEKNTSTNKNEILIIEDSDEDDLFEDQEIEISNEPNHFKSQEVTISNQNDEIEFPEDYEINIEDNKLSQQTVEVMKDDDEVIVIEEKIEEDEELTFEICSKEPQALSDQKTVFKNETNTYNDNTNVDYKQQSNFYENKEYDLEYDKTDSNENKNYHPTRNQNEETEEEPYKFTPITIRPPRNKFLNSDSSNIDSEQDEDYTPLTNEPSEKGLFAKIKKLFKK